MWIKLRSSERKNIIILDLGKKEEMQNKIKGGILGGGGDIKKETPKMKQTLLIGLWIIIIIPFLSPSSFSSPPNSAIAIKIVREEVNVSSNGERITGCRSDDGGFCMDALSSQSIMKGEEKAMVQNALVNSANLAPDVAEAMAFLI
eukprot:15340303-Ditylum_brightwellii.AAC.1